MIVTCNSIFIIVLRVQKYLQSSASIILNLDVKYMTKL